MKHLNEIDRAKIEVFLKDNLSVAQISQLLSRAKSSIWREINIHRKTLKRYGCDCIHFKTCKRDLLDQCKHCGFLDINCKNCIKAEGKCPDFVPAVCNKKSRIGLCNHCTTIKTCKRNRVVYDANDAHEASETAKRDSRAGFAFDASDSARISKIVTPLLQNGQSIYHIFQTHKEEIGVSESTLRRMIAADFISATVMDLPRAVRYKRRNYDYKHKKEVTLAKLGHLKEDFDAFINKFPDTPVVQIDTVLSKKKTAAALLTIMFVNEGLQLAYKLESNSASNVIKVFNYIESAIGLEAFRELFPVILTDNGTEFDEFKAIENSFSGDKRTKVFFCHAYRSNEKPHCENNHTMIRRIIPKKTDFTDLTQAEVDLMMNHINSYKRKSRNNEAPIERIFNWMDPAVARALHIELIPPDEVILKPMLLQGFYDRTNQNSPKLMDALMQGVNGEKK